jgi:acetyl esterase/lipase
MILSGAIPPKAMKAKYKLALALIAISVFINLIYQPLPDGFQQPWKYRLICFGSDLLGLFGRFVELIGLYHRLNVTRLAYHLTIGAFSMRDPNDRIQVTDEFIEHVPIRVYRPMNRLTSHEELLPTIIFFHGGGFFLGSADTLEPVTYLLANQTNCLVVYIEYRLIPEYKYPAQLTDSWLATLYLIKHSLDYKIDLDRLILMGDSAGGNLATVIGNRLIEEEIARPKMQVLIYPILQFFDFTLPSYRINLPKRVLGNIGYENFKNFIHYYTEIEVDDSIFQNGHTSREHKEGFLAQHVNPGFLPYHFRDGLNHLPVLNDTNNKYAKLNEILLSPRVSPLLVTDEFLISYTPEYTYLLTTELDILRDDGFIYAERLRKLGIEIQHEHYDKLFHGVLGLLHGPLQFEVATELIRNVSRSINSVIYN